MPQVCALSTLPVRLLVMTQRLAPGSQLVHWPKLQPSGHAIGVLH
jgi:hypothetical protein